MFEFWTSSKFKNKICLSCLSYFKGICNDFNNDILRHEQLLLFLLKLLIQKFCFQMQFLNFYKKAFSSLTKNFNGTQAFADFGISRTFISKLFTFPLKQYRIHK